MGQHKNNRKRLTKIRHIVQPPTPDDFTQEELWGVPGDPLRPGRAFLCRDDIEQRMRIVAQNQSQMVWLRRSLPNSTCLIGWTEDYAI